MGKKRRKLVKGKVENWKRKEEKRRKLVREGGKLKTEGRKIIKGGEDLFFVLFCLFLLFFCFSLFKTSQICCGSTKMEIFYRGKKSGKKWLCPLRKISLLHTCVHHDKMTPKEDTESQNFHQLFFTFRDGKGKEVITPTPPQKKNSDHFRYKCFLPFCEEKNETPQLLDIFLEFQNSSLEFETLSQKIRMSCLGAASHPPHTLNTPNAPSPPPPTPMSSGKLSALLTVGCGTYTFKTRQSSSLPALSVKFMKSISFWGQTIPYLCAFRFPCHFLGTGGLNRSSPIGASA